MGDSLKQIIVPAVITLASVGILLILRSIALRLLYRWAKRTDTQLDDIILSSVQNPSLLLVLAIGVHAGLSLSGLPEKHLGYLSKIIQIIGIFAVTLAVSNLAGMLFRHVIRTSAIPLPTTGLAYGMLRGAVLLVGFLVILSVLGISIAPLLTALGVGGIAVALALQDTLANLFAGIHVLLERSVRVGDFIRLESGQEGYVDDITWRTTRVRMLPNNIVVIPNSKLAQSVVTNYYLPEQRMSVLIPISVAYASDPDRVERILVNEAKAGAEVIPGLLSEPEPFVRFIPGFGESSLDFTLICQVREFTDQYLAQHELRKRIFKRFTAEGIEIPYPQRTVHIRQGKEGTR